MVHLTSSTHRRPEPIANLRLNLDTPTDSPPIMPFKIVVAAYSDALRILTFDPVASPPSLTLTSSSPSGKNPSWVAVHPTRPDFILASNEIQPEGKIQLFKLVQNGHALELLQTVDSGGADPAYIVVTENEVLIANVSDLPPYI